MSDLNSYENENLDEIAPNLAKIGRKEGFTLPEGYFDTLSSDIEDAVIVAQSRLGTIPKHNSFEVPKSYFEELTSDIEHAVSFSESKLGAIGKRELFAVPEGYFDGLPSVILQKAIESSKQQSIGGRVINLFREQVFIPAIAASVVALFAIGGIMQLLETSESGSNTSIAQNTKVSVPATNDVKTALVVSQEPEQITLEHIVASQVDEKTIIEAIPEDAMAVNIVSSSEDITEEDIRNFTSDDVSDYLFNETTVSSLVN